MIYLSREVRMSLTGTWTGKVESFPSPANSWAGWPSAVGLEPYMRLRVTVSGQPDPTTGLLCSIEALDQLLRRHALRVTADGLGNESGCGWPERLIKELWSRLAPSVPAPTRLESIEWLVTPFLRYAIFREKPTMVRLTQQFEFSAAHRLHCVALTDEENRDLFGKCNNPNGHGHNYLVDVTVSGTPDETTGSVLPLPRFEQIVKEEVIHRLDHKHLNADTAEFRELNPSVENIARVIWSFLVDRVSPARLTAVRVYETAKTWAEYTGE